MALSVGEAIVSPTLLLPQPVFWVVPAAGQPLHNEAAFDVSAVPMQVIGDVQGVVAVMLPQPSAVPTVQVTKVLAPWVMQPKPLVGVPPGAQMASF